jgi:hypothetical protein
VKVITDNQRLLMAGAIGQVTAMVAALKVEGVAAAATLADRLNRKSDELSPELVRPNALTRLDAARALVRILRMLADELEKEG